ncbi:hypothetical protein [Mycolicibacterium thermoresistibile]
MALSPTRTTRTAPSAAGEDPQFVIEDLSTGVHASGYGQVGDGRSFCFYVERQQLMIEVYRPRLSGPVPQADDIVATATRKLTEIDVTDERSVAAAVRDAVAAARPVARAAY